MKQRKSFKQQREENSAIDDIKRYSVGQVKNGKVSVFNLINNGFLKDFIRKNTSVKFEPSDFQLLVVQEFVKKEFGI